MVAKKELLFVKPKHTGIRLLRRGESGGVSLQPVIYIN